MLPSDITSPTAVNLHHTHVKVKCILVHIKKQLVLSMRDINKCHSIFFNKIEKKPFFLPLTILCWAFFLPGFISLASPCCPDQYAVFFWRGKASWTFVSLDVLQKYHHVRYCVGIWYHCPTLGKYGNTKIPLQWLMLQKVIKDLKMIDRQIHCCRLTVGT